MAKSLYPKFSSKKGGRPARPVGGMGAKIPSKTPKNYKTNPARDGAQKARGTPKMAKNAGLNVKGY